MESLLATEEKQTEKMDVSLSLGQMVEKYSKNFPLRIKVLQGYCAENSELNISTDDVYNIHFMKHTNVVEIKDEDGVMYNIPLGSSMKFGLLYNPNNQYDEAFNGMEFEKISDIVAMSTLPKVVCATKAYQVSDEKNTVDENEILAIRHVHRPMFKGRKGLKVFSLLTKSEKVLPDDCAGHFSTKPSLVRMHLPEIIEYVTNPFPTHAVMYPGSDSAVAGQNMPGTLSRVFTMCDYSKKTSLVASLAEEQASGSLEIFDIPLDEDISEIEVAILEDKNDEESEHLYDDTVNILKSFDPTKLQLLKSNESGDTKNVQSMLLSNVRQGFETAGVAVEPPYENITKRSRVQSKGEDEEETGYATVGFHRQKSRNGRDSGYDRVGYDRASHEDPTISCWLEDLQSATQALEGRLISLEHNQQSTELTK